MKKFLIAILTGIFLTTIISSCHKDIPKDIPDWLREKIKQAKKELRQQKKENGMSGYSWISEYSNGNKLLYRYLSPENSVNYEFTQFYTMEGEEICSFHAVLLDSCGIYGAILNEFYETKKIWESK